MISKVIEKYPRGSGKFDSMSIYTHLKHQSPTILSVMGAAGVIVTTASAIKSTPKAIQLLDSKKSNKGDDLSTLEVLQEVTPLYIPTALFGLATISCIFGANFLNKHNQAMLTSAYGMLEQSYRRYREAACTVFGEDADSKIKAEMARDTYLSSPSFFRNCKVYDPDSDNTVEKVLFYDIHSERYFQSTQVAVINAQYHINRNLAGRGHVTLNEYYEFLGIDGVESGDITGWTIDELYESNIFWLDFDNVFTELDDGMECHVISSMFNPILLSEDYI